MHKLDFVDWLFCLFAVLAKAEANLCVEFVWSKNIFC
jgi:hypothetical protein